jgi:hypothetical protein
MGLFEKKTSSEPHELRFELRENQLTSIFRVGSNIMPPPSNQRATVEPPEQVTREAIKGFATGALRVC